MHFSKNDVDTIKPQYWLDDDDYDHVLPSDAHQHEWQVDHADCTDSDDHAADMLDVMYDPT